MSILRSSTFVLNSAILLAFLFCGGCSKGKQATETAERPAEKDSRAIVEKPEANGTSPSSERENPNEPTSTEDVPSFDTASADPPASAPVESQTVPAGSWTNRRLIVLAPAGPVLIDLSVSVGGKSLDAASEDMLADVASELMPEGEDKPTWEAWLETPAIRSGWLGNLVAEEEQREQLVSMYDTSKDGKVDTEELPAFLSRGLSRTSALQLVDAGNAADVDINVSPWGKADLDDDYSLDAIELANLESAVRSLDLNGDSTLTAEELAEASGARMQSEGMSSRSMLETSSIVFSEASSPSSDESDEASQSNRESRRRATKILRHYTFLESLSREQWPGWSDKLWASVDSNQDQNIDAYEAERLFTVEPQVRMFVGLPAPDSASGQTIQKVIVGQELSASWNEHAGGGHLCSSNCSTVLSVDDAFDATSRQLLRNRLELALGNAQIQAFLRSQLQLGEDAFEIIDGDGDGKLDDDEFSTVWKWLAVRQGSRLLARWEISGNPWFQLADENGDRRLTEIELARLGEKLSGLDRNGDDRLTPNELPMVARLNLTRTDSRLAQGPFDAPTQPSDAADADWFAAMDSNRDGVLNRSEFLGSKADFAHLDGDKDGFVSREEVVVAP